MNRVSSKLRNMDFSFHHEVSTNGVPISLLYFRMVPPSATDTDVSVSRKKRRINIDDTVSSDTQLTLMGRRVGLDPGKQSIIIMICERDEMGNFKSNFLQRSNHKSGVDHSKNSYVMRDALPHFSVQINGALSSTREFVTLI